MKKPKMKLDAAKIQAFFLNHIEKILLVGVVGLMLLLLFAGCGIGVPPVVGIFSRRPVQRSAGSRSTWRKIVVTN